MNIYFNPTRLNYVAVSPHKDDVVTFDDYTPQRAATAHFESVLANGLHTYQPVQPRVEEGASTSGTPHSPIVISDNEEDDPPDPDPDEVVIYEQNPQSTVPAAVPLEEQRQQRLNEVRLRSHKAIQRRKAMYKMKRQKWFKNKKRFW